MPRVKIEQKHTYNNSSQALNGIFRTDYTIADQATNASIVYPSRPSYPIQGVEDNQRIGRKVTATSIVIEGFTQLYSANPGSDLNSAFTKFDRFLADSDLGEASVNLFKVGIRQFVVEVDTEFVQGLTNDELKRKWLKWFHQLVIFTDTSQQVSNSTMVKRESTSYTGQFKILLDKHYILSQKSPQVHYQYTLDYKRELNFDGTGASLPTNKVVYLLTFGPTSLFRDYYNYGYSVYLQSQSGTIGASTNPFYVANCVSNIKLNYIDI